jgi:hypothetical protein
MEDALPTTTRPRTVTLLLLGVFLLGVWNFGRALALSQQTDLHLELTVQPDPRFRFVMALIWGFVFMGMWWLIRKKRPFIRKLLPFMLIIYTIYELGVKIIFAQTQAARQEIWLNLVFYLVLIALITWALTRTAVINYFTNKS